MSNEMNQQPRKRGPMGRMGRGMQPLSLIHISEPTRP